LADRSSAADDSVVDDLVAASSVAGRPLRFDEYMAIALYGAHGFYVSGGQAGRRGDFITSPEVGPLFGAVVARWIEAEWERLSRPADFTVVEAGAGPGTLARAVLSAAPSGLTRYVAVEVSPTQRALHPDGVDSLPALPDGPLTGVLIANELLDNLPFRLAVFDGGWREALVEVRRGGALTEVTVPAPADWDWLPSAAPHGARVPVQASAAGWIRQARRMLAAGSVLIVDYCTPRTVMLATTPWRDWLRTFRAHERGAHYLRDPGLQDITSQVCLDQLPEPSTVRPQGQFLRRWGIEELVEEGRRVWEAEAAAPSLHSLRMRSRVREAESLLDPSGLGGFVVAEWQV
jgi:SAM-dependent MidA family methyltransferase